MSLWCHVIWCQYFTMMSLRCQYITISIWCVVMSYVTMMSLWCNYIAMMFCDILSAALWVHNNTQSGRAALKKKKNRESLGNGGWCPITNMYTKLESFLQVELSMFDHANAWSPAQWWNTRWWSIVCCFEGGPNPLMSTLFPPDVIHMFPGLPCFSFLPFCFNLWLWT